VAARQLAAEGVEAEVLDLRTLSPYDWDAIAASVKRTGRVVVAQEDCLSWGYAAEIAARVAGELFEHLDAPVRRIGALDTFVGYNPSLEDAILPQVSSLAAAIRELARY
jgi:2-oxoisovalerate dehydrogenase E1 component